MERQPPQATPAEGGSSTERLFTIGQVVKQLIDEFPDLSISKVRYLEDRGIINPRRTAGGYRKYAVSDVHRLRSALQLQRDQFLPLEVIKDRLDRGTASTFGGMLQKSQPLQKPDALLRAEPEMTWEEALDVLRVSDGFLSRLAEFRLIDPREDGLSGILEESDVEIARICDLFSRFGLEPRNLRLLRSSVEREFSLVEQVVAPSLRSNNRERREEGRELLLELSTLLGNLQQLLLYKEMRRLNRSISGG
jgi:DNA-binding transcriptional MerR regulator